MKIRISQRYINLILPNEEKFGLPISNKIIENALKKDFFRIEKFYQDLTRGYALYNKDGALKKISSADFPDLENKNISFEKLIDIGQKIWPDIPLPILYAIICFGYQTNDSEKMPQNYIGPSMINEGGTIAFYLLNCWGLSTFQTSSTISIPLTDGNYSEWKQTQVTSKIRIEDDPELAFPLAHNKPALNVISSFKIKDINSTTVIDINTIEIELNHSIWNWAKLKPVDFTNLGTLLLKPHVPFSISLTNIDNLKPYVPFLLEKDFRNKYIEKLLKSANQEKTQEYIHIASCFLDNETYPKESALFFRELAHKIARLKKAERVLFISSSLSALKNLPIEKSKLLQALIKNKTCFRSLENHLNNKQGQDKSNFAAEVFSALIAYPAEQKKWLKLFTKESQLTLIETSLNIFRDKPEEKAALLAGLINHKFTQNTLLNLYKRTSNKNILIYDTIIALKNHPKELKIWILRLLNNEARRQDLIRSGVLDHLFTIPTPSFLESSQIIQSSLILRDLIASNPKKIFSRLYKNSSIKNYLQQKAISALRKQEAADRYGKEWVDAANILLDIDPKINTRKSRYQITSEDNAHAIDFNIGDRSAISLLRRFLKKNLLHRLVPRFGLWERAWGLWKLSVNTADEAFNLMITHPYHLGVSGWFFNRRILGFVKSWAEKMSSEQLLNLFIFAPITRKRLSNNESLAIEALRLYESKALQSENLITLFNHSKTFRQLLKQKDKEKFDALAFIYRLNKRIINNNEELANVIDTIVDIGTETFTYISKTNPFFRQLIEHHLTAQAKQDNISNSNLQSNVEQLLSLDTNTFSTLFRTNKYVSILLTQYLDSIKDSENDPLKEIIQNRLIGYFYELLQTTNNNQEVKDEKLIARHLATLYLLYPLQQNIFLENQGLLADLSKLEDNALIKELLKDENLTTSKVPEIQMFVKRLTKTNQKLEKAQPPSNNKVVNTEHVIDETQLTKHSTAIAAIMPLAKKLNLFDKNAQPLSKALAEYSPKLSIRNTHR